MSANQAGFFHSILSTGPAVRLGLLIGQHLPPRIGYGIADFIAGVIVRAKTGTYRNVCGNLRHVLGAQVDDRVLHRTVYKVFAHAGRAYYDFYRAVNWSREELVEAVQVPEHYIDLMQTQSARGQGIFVLGLHMSNFDLALVSLAARGMPTQVLSLPDPGQGYRVQDRLRASVGIEVTPISPASLRLAIRRLERGWLVFTGVDRPVTGEHEPIEFFGHPSNLSTGPARLALMSGATVLVAGCHRDPHTRYSIDFTGPLEMVQMRDRRRAVRVNAQRIAHVLEGLVRARPEQWLMFHSVWPQPPHERGEAGRWRSWFRLDR
jgi:lauroyl/myristoyl acyltransferase